MFRLILDYFTLSIEVLSCISTYNQSWMCFVLFFRKQRHVFNLRDAASRSITQHHGTLLFPLFGK